jgi:hypothetical protein
MPIQLGAPQIEWITHQVRDYILGQREHYSPRCAPLEGSQALALRGFFPHEVLRSARVCVLQGERVENPAFYPQLRQWGILNVLDFEDMAAITLVDIVVSHIPFDHQLLFHELVHVMQYRALGVDEFARLYVRGFLGGGAYEKIPLEMQAYELDGRFALATNETFSVKDEVRTWMEEGRY